VPDCSGSAGSFLASLGAEEAQVEAAFREAIATAQATEVGFDAKTRRSNLRGIPPPKKRAGREDVDSAYLFDNAQ